LTNCLTHSVVRLFLHRSNGSNDDVQQRKRFLLRQRIDLAFGGEQELQACVVAAEQGMFVDELELTRTVLADLLESFTQMSAEKHLSADMCAAEESVTRAFKSGSNTKI